MRRSSIGDKIPPLSGQRPSDPDACCKVERVANAYNLDGINTELRRRYEAEDGTLHELATYINNRITAVVLDTIELSLDAEPSTVRAALQEAESVPPTERDTIRANLAGAIDVEILTKSYVSHETVRRHLNEHLNVSTEQIGFNNIEELREVLQTYEEQYKSGVIGGLYRARKIGLIEGEEFTVFSTRIECSNCSRTYDLMELIDNRGCACQKETQGDSVIDEEANVS